MRRGLWGQGQDLGRLGEQSAQGRRDQRRPWQGGIRGEHGGAGAEVDSLGVHGPSSARGTERCPGLRCRQNQPQAHITIPQQAAQLLERRRRVIVQSGRGRKVEHDRARRGNSRPDLGTDRGQQPISIIGREGTGEPQAQYTRE